MQEQEVIKYNLVYWEVITDGGKYKISEKQKDILMKAESAGAKFVEFDDVILNLSFIREVQKKHRVSTSGITDSEKKFVTDTQKETIKLLD